MSKKTWILTDVDSDIFQEQINLGPEQVGGSARGYSVTKRTLRGGLREGVEVVEVDNGRLRFVVIPTRGMGIWRASCGDVQLGWRSPVKGPVHPKFVPTWDGSGLGWLSGFDELLVRCGLQNNGAPEFGPNGALQWPLHGQVSSKPAHKLEVTIDGETGEIAVTGVVDESRLFGAKLRLTSTIRTRVGSCEMTVSDEVQNISAEPGEMQLLYHINFGAPLLAQGAKLSVPFEKLAPHNAHAAANLPKWNVYGPETPGMPEACFFFDLSTAADGQTRAVLESAAGDRGVSIKFNKKQLPHFIQWKSHRAAADGYVTGLEPSTNFPNCRSFEKQHGRVVALAPGEIRRFDISIEAHTDAGSLAAAKKVVADIQGAQKPEISEQPNPQWSAGC